MLRSPIVRLVKIAGLILLLCLAVIYAGGLVLGIAGGISAVIIRVLEFIGVVGFPLAGLAVLSWFAYRLLLQPVFRQRKLDRIREYRARRSASRLDKEQTELPS